MTPDLANLIASTGPWPSDTAFIEVTASEWAALKDGEDNPLEPMSLDMVYMRVSFAWPGSSHLEVIVPFNRDEIQLEGAPKTVRSRVLEAAQIVAHQQGKAWPSDWPTGAREPMAEQQREASVEDADLTDRAWAAWANWYPSDEERRYSEAHGKTFVEGYKRAYEEMRQSRLVDEFLAERDRALPALPVPQVNPFDEVGALDIDADGAPF